MIEYDRWDFHGIIELNEDSEWDSEWDFQKSNSLDWPSPLDQGGCMRLLELRLQSAGQELHKFRGQGVVRTTTVWPGMVTGHHESPRMFLLAFGTPSNIWRIGRIWKNDAVVVGKLETSQITRDSKCQIWRLKCADRAVLNKVPDNGAWRKHQALVVGLLGLPQMARFCFGNTRIASDCYSDILFFRWFLSG